MNLFFFFAPVSMQWVNIITILTQDCRLMTNLTAGTVLYIYSFIYHLFNCDFVCLVKCH